ncbi:MAG: relaxase/mobilization nuclease domain-containing protein [Clostridia bacterium]|nr:relaxase/mobilization nuclease domain-containing protein [Clostridia bacterium]
MAVTKLWVVNDNLGRVIDYAKNPTKTHKPKYSKEDIQSLRDVLAYATDEEKTDKELYVTGIHCDKHNARADFIRVKKQFQKTDGVQAYHGYMSFAPDELTPDECHQIGIEFAQRMWGDKFQVVVTTHLNTKSLHNHFVVNSVSFVDGKRLHNEKAWFIFRRVADDICKEHGLGIIEKPETHIDSRFLQECDKKNMPTRYNLAKAAIDDAIAHSRTMGEFQRNLIKLGYYYDLSKNRKYWTIRPMGSKKSIRLYRLGEEYTNKRIQKRIEENTLKRNFQRNFQGYSPPPYNPHYDIRRVKGSLYNLYLYYCYRLGCFDKPEQKQPPHKLHYLIRQDLMKVEKYSQEARLLGKHHIDTTEQLLSFKESCEKETDALIEERKHLRNQERHKDISESERSEIKSKIASISKKLKELRTDISLCEDIVERSQEIERRTEQIRKDDEKLKTKEVRSHEQFQRRR